MAQKVIFHLDLDAFFAAVETLDHPEYAGKPLIVGGEPGGRGVVSTCNYEARKFGIHSAMPTFRAYKLCPQGIFVHPNMKRYQEKSKEVMDIFEAYTPDIKQVSIDEAYLDMTGTERLLGSPVEVAARLKEEVHEKTGLTISVGVAPNHFLAKIASDCQKPNGLTVVHPGEEETFLNSIALRKIPGLGKKMQERLDELGILSTEQLRSYPKAELISLTGKGSGEFLWRAARGLESPDHGLPVKNHSLSAETTLREDTNNKDTLRKVILDLSQQVMFRMLKGKWKGRTPFLKVRYEDFRTFTVQKTLAHYMTSGEELHQVMMAFLHEKWKGSPKIRLIGLGFHSIEKIDEYSQGELFEDDNTRKRQVEESVFRIKSRFPELPLVKASLLGRKNRSSPKDAGLKAQEEAKAAKTDGENKKVGENSSKSEEAAVKQQSRTAKANLEDAADGRRRKPPIRSLGKKAVKSTRRSRGGRGKSG